MHATRGERLGSYRCTKRNCLQSRISRATGTVEWPCKEAQKEFFQQHSSLKGTKLKQQLYFTLSHMEKATTVDKDGHDIEWLDEIDLQTKYQNKPEQLKSILEKAERREHPTRSVTLYADITTTTMHSKAHAVELEAKRKAASFEVVKANEPIKSAKKLKQERPPRNGEPPARKAKPLNTKQRAMFSEYGAEA